MPGPIAGAGSGGVSPVSWAAAIIALNAAPATANATTPYVLGFVNTARTGPLVIDFPSGETAGGIGDFWERNISDFGMNIAHQR